jgi:HNH endonuclease
VSADQISEAVRARIREQADNRCGYCLSPQHLVLGVLEIEHLVPKSRGGTDDEDNLWLACRLCNGFKAAQTQGRDPAGGRLVDLFNPRRQRWQEHFQWSEDGARVVGTTTCGRATVIALQLNNWIAVMVRREWIAAGWHPPRHD